MKPRIAPLRLFVVFLLSGLSLAGCGQQDSERSAARIPVDLKSAALGAFTDLDGALDIAGGTAHIPVMKEAAERIMKANPGIRITVAGGGSGVGIQKVGEGLVQIGNAGRALSAEERVRYGLTSHAFAVDGVCAVVHRDNPIAGLTSRQLQDIFAGRISNWNELGGPDAEIRLYTRDEASGTRKVFWDKALHKDEIHPAANVVASNGAMKTAVAGDPAAIGYVSIGHLDESLRAPDLDGVAVTQENASSGVYPVVRRLYMNTKGDPGPLANAFIAYVTGPEGAGIVRSCGYLPVAD